MFRTLFGATLALLCAVTAVGCQSNGGSAPPAKMSMDPLPTPATILQSADATSAARRRQATIDRNSPPYTKYPHLGRNHFNRPVSNDTGES